MSAKIWCKRRITVKRTESCYGVTAYNVDHIEQIVDRFEHGVDGDVHGVDCVEHAVAFIEHDNAIACIYEWIHSSRRRETSYFTGKKIKEETPWGSTNREGKHKCLSQESFFPIFTTTI